MKEAMRAVHGLFRAGRDGGCRQPQLHFSMGWICQAVPQVI